MPPTPATQHGTAPSPRQGGAPGPHARTPTSTSVTLREAAVSSPPTSTTPAARPHSWCHGFCCSCFQIRSGKRVSRHLSQTLTRAICLNRTLRQVAVDLPPEDPVTIQFTSVHRNGDFATAGSPLLARCGSPGRQGGQRRCSGWRDDHRTPAVGGGMRGEDSDRGDRLHRLTWCADRQPGLSAPLLAVDRSRCASRPG